MLHKNVRFGGIIMSALTQGFSRLQGIFRSGINFQNYEALLGTAVRKTTGNLSDDILGLLLQGGKKAKGKSIKGVQAAFENTANILGQINKLERQAINRTPINRCTFERIKYLIGKGEIKFWKQDALYAEKELETVIKAEETLLKGIKEHIPQAKNVVITPLGSGKFGNAYKCEILGENAQKLVSDKVIKIYRDDTLFATFSDKIKSFINSDAVIDLLKEEIKKEKDPEKVKKLQKMLDKLPAVRRIFNRLEKQMFANMKAVETVHGAAAEANITEYLRFFSGHKVKPTDGVALPDMFGLDDTKFAISEFIGKETKATKRFSFERLGLTHSDFELNPNNGINGICIDMGGIAPTAGRELVGNKQGLKILKSLFSTSGVKSSSEQVKEALSQHNISDSLKKEIEFIFSQNAR